MLSVASQAILPPLQQLLLSPRHMDIVAKVCTLEEDEGRSPQKPGQEIPGVPSIHNVAQNWRGGLVGEMGPGGHISLIPWNPHSTRGMAGRRPEWDLIQR